MLCSRGVRMCARKDRVRTLTPRLRRTLHLRRCSSSVFLMDGILKGAMVSIQRVGLRGRNLRATVRIVHKTFLGCTRVRRVRCGNKKAGYTRTTRVGGSSGTAGITWAAGTLTMRARLHDGRPSDVTSHSSCSVARVETPRAGEDSDKRSCTGRMTVEHTNPDAYVA